MPSIRSSVYILGPQLVVLFRKVEETLAGEALLGKLLHIR